MIRAAGVLFLEPGGCALFLKRGPGSDHPLVWCCPGGQLEDGETTLEAAIRETAEEAGYEATLEELTEHTRTLALAEPVDAAEAAVPVGVNVPPSEDCDFTTYLCRVPAMFTPVLCPEHTGFAWASVDAPPEPLHPGMRVALDRLNMNELDIAHAIAEGRLMSPVRYGNMWLVAMRVTGTGLSYRDKLEEHVWRDPELYLNPEFLERCQGLPVIMQHSPGALDSKEFAKRIVGTSMLPYIKGQDVWTVSRMYDDAAVKLLLRLQLSTSPMVILGVDNDKVQLEDGKKYLIEGKAVLLDHLAICEKGVWDKGGEPAGIDVTGVKADSVVGVRPAMLDAASDPDAKWRDAGHSKAPREGYEVERLQKIISQINWEVKHSDPSASRRAELSEAKEKLKLLRAKRSDGGMGRAYLDSVLARCDVSHSRANK